MSHSEVNYGPLKKLIGCWKGIKGLDIAPEPDGAEQTPYHEEIVFTGIGTVTNAEKQVLAVLQYRQQVRRDCDNAVFHDQCGYWSWDQQTGALSHSFSIPRGVSLTASGRESNGVISVRADKNDIAQTAFMQQQAQTVEFTQTLEVSDSTFSYQQLTLLEIYGRPFEHRDSSELVRA